MTSPKPLYPGFSIPHNHNYNPAHKQPPTRLRKQQRSYLESQPPPTPAASIAGKRLISQRISDRVIGVQLWRCALDTARSICTLFCLLSVTPSFPLNPSVTIGSDSSNNQRPSIHCLILKLDRRKDFRRRSLITDAFKIIGLPRTNRCNYYFILLARYLVYISHIRPNDTRVYMDFCDSAS